MNIKAVVDRLRPKRTSAATKVQALLGLASLVRAGAPLRAALAEWPEAAPEDARPFLGSAARRAQLGAPLQDAIASCAELLGPDLDALRSGVILHLECGADAAAMIEGIAEEISRREVGSGNARAQAAGARLSARLVGGLPLAFLPLMPPGKVELFDPLGLVLLVSGLLLAVGGMRWLGSLLPDPPTDDDLGAYLASAIARCLQAGTDIGRAVDLAASGAPTRSPEELSLLVQAARRVRLGIPARRALLLGGDDGLEAVGRCLELAHRSGAPPSSYLLALADARRAEQGRRFEAEMRRAPVKMVVPLTLCVLPSFALLGLAPFLRGVTLGA